MAASSREHWREGAVFGSEPCDSLVTIMDSIPIDDEEVCAEELTPGGG